jgi:hypothetical protein
MDEGFVEPVLDELERPEEWIPSWFKLSPSMITYSYDQCGQKFIYKYMHRMKPKDIAPSLSRTMAFRHAIFNWRNYIANVSGVGLGEQSVDEVAIELAVRDYFKGIANVVADSKNIDRPTTSEELMDTLRPYYKWNKKIPSIEVLMNQSYESAKEVIAYMQDIEVALDPEMKFATPIQQKHLMAELMLNGEILDETFGRPTQFQTTLQFLSEDGTIYLFKISDSKMYIPNMACYISDEPAIMAAALQQYVSKANGDFIDEFNVVILRAVVNNGGGCHTLEEHKKTISTSDMDEVLYKLADAAKDIKSVKLHRKKQLSCAWCEMKDPCLFGKTSGHQIPASEAIHDRNFEGRIDDDDDLPY